MAGTKLVLCGFVALSAVVGCGGDDKQAVTGQPTATQCAPGQYFDGRICQSPTGTAPAATTPAATAPAATVPAGFPALPPIPVATAASGPTATPIDPAAAAVVTGPLTLLAPPGMKPVGAPIAGTFAQGQSLEQIVQLNNGKCYTVVAVGVPGQVQNVDVQFKPTLAALGTVVLASDSTVGATAILGQNPCYKATALTPTLKLVVTVTAGQGIAAAQVFEK